MALALGLALAPPPAAAQPREGLSPAEQARSQMLFEEGRKLREAGRCDQAIDKLKASQALAPAVGTLLNLADCHQDLGQTASAWARFEEASALAQQAGDARRAQYARERADAVEATLSRLEIQVTRPAPGLVVTRDGQPVSEAELGLAMPVDPGTVEVEARAPGFTTWREAVVVGRDGAEVRIDVPPLEAIEREDPGLSTRAILGYSLLGVGGAALIAGTILGVRSRLLDGRSDAFCPTDPDVCLPEASAIRDDARAHEIAAIVTLSAGGAAAAIGAGLLWLAADTDPTATANVAVTPWVGPGTLGASVSTRF